jgi:hypothetical protein
VFTDLTVLCLSAISVGAIHTLLGPDHYVPLVAMSRVGGWSLTKTLGVTAACGLGQVAGAVVVGAVGLALGTTAMELEAFRVAEAAREKERIAEDSVLCREVVWQLGLDGQGLAVQAEQLQAPAVKEEPGENTVETGPKKSAVQGG